MIGSSVQCHTAPSTLVSSDNPLTAPSSLHPISVRYLNAEYLLYAVRKDEHRLAIIRYILHHLRINQQHSHIQQQHMTLHFNDINQHSYTPQTRIRTITHATTDRNTNPSNSLSLPDFNTSGQET